MRPAVLLEKSGIMAARKNDNRPIVDRDVKALVASGIASLVKVYGLTVAQAAARIGKEAERVAWDVANAAVLNEMKGTGLGVKPANDAPAAKPVAVKPGVAKAAPVAPVATTVKRRAAKR